MKRSLGCSITLLLASALPAPAQAPAELPPSELYVLRLEYLRWNTVLDADVQKGSSGVPGTPLNARNDLGVGDDNTSRIHGAYQIRPGFKLRGTWAPLNYSGDVTAGKAFRFQGTNYGQGSHILTSLKGHYYEGLLEYDIFKLGNRGYIGIMIGAKILDVDNVIVAPDQGQREVDTITLPIPVVGATARIFLGSSVSVNAEFAGISLGDTGNAYDADLTLQIHLSDRFSLKGGYRYFSITGNDEPDSVKLKIKGLVFGAEVSL